MNDYLLTLAKSPTARRAIKQLGLPVPIPQPLERNREPTRPHPLREHRIALHGSPDSPLLHPASQALLGAGATLVAPPHLADLEDLREEARSQEGRLVETPIDDDSEKVDGLVFDASRVEHPDDLDRLYEFFHPRLRSLRPCGKAVVLARPDQTSRTVATAAARRGIEGFTRSLAREGGRFGQTANLLVVEEGAEGRLDRSLR